ncbi:hypothetical protein Mal15_22190 [Stieleria maiorica]|uniref:Uncharacterized protein n=1 Tax=Stieleria maiorica TaxID=2795974 RepID=A0A5B9MA52_9BACT|nr:hypothetical protein [Stieleria maiorica]QEF98171.1 hypothetical protein Mal15_22190 [Stieleria maiorica]
MLELHRVDLRIVEAAGGFRRGATVQQIQTAMADPVSIDSIKRHLPGLVRLGALRGAKDFRDEQMVTVWISIPAERERERTQLFSANSQNA